MYSLSKTGRANLDPDMRHAIYCSVVGVVPPSYSTNFLDFTFSNLVHALFFAVVAVQLDFIFPDGTERRIIHFMTFIIIIIIFLD